MFSADILDNEGNKIRTLARGTFDVSSIVKEINGNDSAEFHLPSSFGIGESRVDNPALEDLSVQKNGIRKVNIYYEKTPFNRKLLFSGFIFIVSNTPLRVSYQCAGIQAYMFRKSINQAVSYNSPSDTVFSVLNSEWEKINTRYQTGIKIISTDNTITTAEIDEGEKFGQTMNRMVDLGFEYKYEYPNVTIEPTIGNVIKKPLSYHYASTGTANVIPPDVTIEDGNLLGNSCYGKTDTGSAFFSNVPPTQEEISIFKNFRDGDAQTKAEEYVNDYSNGESEYSLILENHHWDLGEIDAGDFVNLNIIRGYSVMDMIGPSRVMRKEITSDGSDITQTISVSNVPFQDGVTEDILKRLKSLEDLV